LRQRVEGGGKRAEVKKQRKELKYPIPIYRECRISNIEISMNNE
jgi:hypothetical protein